MWFALEMICDHSVVYQVAPKYRISDSFVDEGYSSSWETHMQVRKQQLDLDMEQQTGSK